MPKKPSAILFDLDDTIVAWDIISPRVWEETCLKFAPQLGLDTNTLLFEINHFRAWYLSDMERHRFARLNLPVFRKEIVTMAFTNLNLETNGLVDLIAGHYGEGRERAAYLIPGAIETLQHFKARGTKLALISNGMADGQRRKVLRFNLEQYFDCILIEGEFSTGKPDKRVFQHALSELEVSAEEAWMVGDSLYFDISGGKAAGLYTVRVAWGGVETFATPVNPDRVVKNISELMNEE